MELTNTKFNVDIQSLQLEIGDLQRKLQSADERNQDLIQQKEKLVREMFLLLLLLFCSRVSRGKMSLML